MVYSRTLKFGRGIVMGRRRCLVLSTCKSIQIWPTYKMSKITIFLLFFPQCSMFWQLAKTPQYSSTWCINHPGVTSACHVALPERDSDKLVAATAFSYQNTLGLWESAACWEWGDHESHTSSNNSVPFTTLIYWCFLSYPTESLCKLGREPRTLLWVPRSQPLSHSVPFPILCA